MPETFLTPLLPLRDVVVYPHMVIPLFVGRDKSIRALEATMHTPSKMVALVAQKSSTDEHPSTGNMYAFGTIATILQMLKLPDGTVKVLVEGQERVKIVRIQEEAPYILVESVLVLTQGMDDKETEVLVKTLLSQFERYVKLNKKIPPEMIASVIAIEDPSRLSDTIAAHMSLKVHEKQTLLEMIDLRLRIERLIEFMETEIDLFQVETRIRSNVKKQMEKNQREYYLNEQMKAIHEELGHEHNDVNSLKERIMKAEMSEEAQKKALSEMSKLKSMPAMSAEATVSRNYIEWMLNVPWKKRSKVRYDIAEAQKILDLDHYGLDKVKERILEYLAVQKRVKKFKSPILCLVGPPGVGKTSLGRSIARATQRQYIRVALGGVRDEAEIRGHRRTYIGAMPGKILQKLAKVGVRNPLFLLDEIDKMSMDARGDPASALLEVLDPEQNEAFSDHYLEVDYDLSDVMFIATANTLDIPAALKDRMEVIHLAGYTEDEKLNIAINYLIPKQIKENGLEAAELSFTAEAILDIIRYYTKEAGVRHLEREISKVCRKVVKHLCLLPKEQKSTEITVEQLEEYLGIHKHRFGMAEEENRVGQVTGLAWTQMGGDTLTIEATVMPGKGVTTRTGKLGEVMQESIQAAQTVIRSRAYRLGISVKSFETMDVHIHVPEGATPKDGPSAGVGMCTALLSAYTGIPVRANVAMTGEITLRGEVLPIGGLKEKLLAAKRAGIQQVIIPEENRADLKEIPDNIKKELHIHCVKWIDEVFALALVYQPVPLQEMQAVVLPVSEGAVIN